MKSCSKCKEIKPADGFYVNKKAKSGLSSQCRACCVQNSKRWLDRNGGASYNSAKKRKQYLRNYGITEEDYQSLLEAQGGVCAICGGTDWSGSKGTPSIDHCHESGKVRGLLCMGCNVALGRFKDDIELLARAIEYLGTHR